MSYYLTSLLTHLLATEEDMKDHKAAGPQVVHDFIEKMIKHQYFCLKQNMHQALQRGGVDGEGQRGRGSHEQVKPSLWGNHRRLPGG